MEKSTFQILIADDARTNRAILRKMVNVMGFESDEAVNGMEVLEAVREKQYGLILLDIQMPILDGVGATAQIMREIPAEKRPLIVAVTGNAEMRQRESYLGLGMFDVLVKPIRLHQVKALIERCEAAWRETAV